MKICRFLEETLSVTRVYVEEKEDDGQDNGESDDETRLTYFATHEPLKSEFGRG